MPMLQAILLSAGDFARGALHAKKFPEPIRMQLLDFYSRALYIELIKATKHSACHRHRHIIVAQAFQVLESAELVAHYT